MHFLCEIHGVSGFFTWPWFCLGTSVVVQPTSLSDPIQIFLVLDPVATECTCTGHMLLSESRTMKESKKFVFGIGSRKQYPTPGSIGISFVSLYLDIEIGVQYCIITLQRNPRCQSRWSPFWYIIFVQRIPFPHKFEKRLGPVSLTWWWEIEKWFPQAMELLSGREYSRKNIFWRKACLGVAFILGMANVLFPFRDITRGILSSRRYSNTRVVSIRLWLVIDEMQRHAMVDCTTQTFKWK